MLVLYIHGMGRSPISGWPLCWRLGRAGVQTRLFGYSTAFEDAAAIIERLQQRMLRLASQSDYVVVGHSLGGLLARAAINSLPPGTRLPAHLYLLGSPVRPSRFAVRLQRNPLFRALTRDCGRLLASTERMDAIGPVAAPTTAIIGVRGFMGQHGLFDAEPNDGVVAVDEVSADWFTRQIQVPVIHTFLPSSAAVSAIIAQGLARHGARPII